MQLRERGRRIACIVTAAHCVPTAAAATGTRAVFDDRAVVALEPARLFVCARRIDVTICALGEGAPCASTRCCGAYPTRGDVHVVCLPWAGRKRVLDGRICLATSCALFHTARTAPGASGAPILDSAWRLLGIHIGKTRLVLSERRHLELAEGVCIGAVAEVLRAHGYTLD